MRKTALAAAAAALFVSQAALAISDFSLPWVNGPGAAATYSSSSHADAVFVVETFQLRCGYCNENAPKVQELARFYSYEPRVQVLDLGIDRSRRDNEQWIARHNPAFPVLMDGERKVWGELQGSGTPTTYVLDCKLDVKWKHVGTWDDATRAELKRVIDRELGANCRR